MLQITVSANKNVTSDHPIIFVFIYCPVDPLSPPGGCTGHKLCLRAMQHQSFLDKPSLGFP